jgi:hypothetical protein
MRPKARSPILAVMDEPSLTVTLELRVEGDALSGRATGENDESIEFDGWLGLLAALDAFVLTTSDTSPGRKS